MCEKGGVGFRLPGVQIHARFITCGYGVEDESEERTFPFPNVNNAYYSFAQQTARRFGAQCVPVSRSGICFHYDRVAPGTCNHPSLKRQTRMAEELESFLRQLMGW